MSYRDRKKAVRGAIVLLIAAAGVAIVFFVGQKIEAALRPASIRGDLGGSFTPPPRIEYEGAEYIKKENLLTILFIGVDIGADSTHIGATFRDGGQADFLLLLILDTKNNEVTRLQIDRDTMAEITILSVLGKPSGSRVAQICLSHGFGDGGKQSSEFTVQAVEKLLCGMEIDHYISMNLDSIAALNEALGGVTVTIEDDFSAYGKDWKVGDVVTLKGEEPELFVRTRYFIGEGTNEARMRRQKTFLNATMKLMDEKINDNVNFVGELYDILVNYIVSDMKRGQMINETYKAAKYARSEILYPKGEYVVGESGFMEFHADEKAIERLVFDIFYEKI